MQVIGNLHVCVQYGTQEEKLVLVVVGGNRPSLFGRNWLTYICLTEGLGTMKPYTATLHVQPDATPRFLKPRPVPFAIKDIIGLELDRLETQGIIKKVTHSEWAAPIVAFPKKDGKFRICGDHKVTINQALSVTSIHGPSPQTSLLLLQGERFLPS